MIWVWIVSILLGVGMIPVALRPLVKASGWEGKHRR